MQPSHFGQWCTVGDVPETSEGNCARAIEHPHLPTSLIGPRSSQWHHLAALILQHTRRHRGQRQTAAHSEQKEQVKRCS